MVFDKDANLALVKLFTLVGESAPDEFSRVLDDHLIREDSLQGEETSSVDIRSEHCAHALGCLLQTAVSQRKRQLRVRFPPKKPKQVLTWS